MAGCAAESLGPGLSPARGVVDREDPFAPTTMRIHPLTHLDARSSPRRGAGEANATLGAASDGGRGGGGGGVTSAGGGDVLMLHVELTDAYGDTVKGLGKLAVQLYRRTPGSESGAGGGGGAGSSPGSAAGSGPLSETQDSRWDIAELAEPDGNAKRFDPATRTYRLQLKAPDWVAGELARSGGWVRVRCVFAAATRRGERVLVDEFVLQK